MSEMHSETVKERCAHGECVCLVTPGAGYLKDDLRYCGEECAQERGSGCHHDGCHCGDR